MPTAELEQIIFTTRNLSSLALKWCVFNETSTGVSCTLKDHVVLFWIGFTQTGGQLYPSNYIIKSWLFVKWAAGKLTAFPTAPGDDTPKPCSEHLGQLVGCEWFCTNANYILFCNEQFSIISNCLKCGKTKAKQKQSKNGHVCWESNVQCLATDSCSEMGRQHICKHFEKLWMKSFKQYIEAWKY